MTTNPRGPRRPRRGRPALGDAAFSLRCWAAQRDRWSEAADDWGEDRAQWVRDALDREADAQLTHDAAAKALDPEVWQVVERLAGEGWTPEEIARALRAAAQAVEAKAACDETFAAAEMVAPGRNRTP